MCIMRIMSCRHKRLFNEVKCAPHSTVPFRTTMERHPAPFFSHLLQWYNHNDFFWCKLACGIVQYCVVLIEPPLILSLDPAKLLLLFKYRLLVKQLVFQLTCFFILVQKIRSFLHLIRYISTKMQTKVAFDLEICSISFI